jgi:hypothetical protein
LPIEEEENLMTLLEMEPKFLASPDHIRHYTYRAIPAPTNKFINKILSVGLPARRQDPLHAEV